MNEAEQRPIGVWFDIAAKVCSTTREPLNRRCSVTGVNPQNVYRSGREPEFAKQSIGDRTMLVFRHEDKKLTSADHRSDTFICSDGLVAND